LEGKLALAEVIAAGARARDESRGGHCRVDNPQRDDHNWLKHTVAHCGADGPALSYGEVAITDFPVEERGP
jgi:succinate dehydrogenase/fumarate reductase flavoprotein subunit